MNEREKVIEIIKSAHLIPNSYGYKNDRVVEEYIVMSCDLIFNALESAGYIAQSYDKPVQLEVAPAQEPTNKELEAFKNSPAKKTLDKLYNQMMELVKMQVTPVKVFETPIQEPVKPDIKWRIQSGKLDESNNLVTYELIDGYHVVKIKAEQTDGGEND